jgi:molybdopterin biosynthesis enzyme MoaB
MQAIADTAAYAGALEKAAGSDTQTITSAAVQSVSVNGLGTGTIVVNIPPKSGANTAKDAVEVIVRKPRPCLHLDLQSD